MNRTHRALILSLAASMLFGPALRAQAPPPARPLPRHRLVSRAVARIPLGRRPLPHGGRAHPLRPYRRVRLVHNSSPPKATTTSTGFSAPSTPPHATTSPSSSERPAPRLPPGSPPSIPRPSASRKMAAPTSTATASSSTGRTPNIASSPAPWPSRIAKRFGHDPNVIGWQIDNEYANVSYGPADQAQIRRLAQGPLRHPRQPQRHAGPPPTGARPTPPGRRSPSKPPTAIPASCSAGSASSPTPGAATRKISSTPSAPTPSPASSSPPT